MPWPVFPACPSFGFSKRADYSVTVVERASGVRTRNRNWYYPLHTFVAVPLDTIVEADAALIARFWHAIGGQAGSFLLKDYTDFSSAARPAIAVTSLDQPALETTESSGSLQLVKLYVDETLEFQQQRLIQKPKQGTIVIAEDGASLVEGVDYDIDYETGLVTPLASMSGVITWGGEFYVPVMFETVPDFMIKNRSQGAGFIQQTEFALRELRLDTPSFVESS